MVKTLLFSTMKATLLSFVFIFLSSQLLLGQNGPCGMGIGTLIFNEDFEGEADAATAGVDATGKSWALNCPACVNGDFFEVDDNAGNAINCNVSQGLRGNDTNGPATFSVTNIDLTGCEVISFSFDYCSSGYTGTGNLECVEECDGCSGLPSEVVSNGGCNNCWDFLYGELDFGGGVVSQEVLLGDDCNVADSGSSTSSICGSLLPDGTPISPNQLASVDINIVMAMWAGTENMVIDNVVLICYTAADVAVCTDPTVSDACPVTCPDLTTINTTDIEVSIQNNVCPAIPGEINAPSGMCPDGSTLMFSMDGGTTFSDMLPTYDATVSQEIITICECDINNTMTSAQAMVTTSPIACCAADVGSFNSNRNN